MMIYAVQIDFAILLCSDEYIRLRIFRKAREKKTQKIPINKKKKKHSDHSFGGMYLHTTHMYLCRQNRQYFFFIHYNQDLVSIFVHPHSFAFYVTHSFRFFIFWLYVCLGCYLLQWIETLVNVKCLFLFFFIRCASYYKKKNFFFCVCVSCGRCSQIIIIKAWSMRKDPGTTTPKQTNKKKKWKKQTV